MLSSGRHADGQTVLPEEAVAWRLLLFLSLTNLCIHLCLSGRYGYDPDDFYMMALGNRLEWGNVSFGSFTPFVCRLSMILFGNSLFAIRFFPAVAGALTVLLAGMLARELGAGRWGQGVASLSVFICPAILAVTDFCAYYAYEPLSWLACEYLLVRLLKNDRPVMWCWFGVVAGLGLMNTPKMLLLGVALIVGLLLSSSRRQLLNGWLWAGGCIALGVFSPFIWWHFVHDWPILHFSRNIVVLKPEGWDFSTTGFFAAQAVILNLFNVPVCLLGLAFLFRARATARVRVLGWLFVVPVAFWLVFRGMIHYVMPAYPLVLAAGGAAIENLVKRSSRPVLRRVVPAVLVAGGVVFAPMGLPLLPLEWTLRYTVYTGRCVIGDRLGSFVFYPMIFASELGWKEIIEAVDKVFQGLSPQDRDRCTIFSDDYVLASAVNFLGKELGLPEAVSPNQQYFFWGPPAPPRGEIAIALITLTKDGTFMRRFYEDVELAGGSKHPDLLPEGIDTEVPVYLCRHPIVSLRSAWPSLWEYMLAR